MSRIGWIIILVVVAVGAGGAGWYYWSVVNAPPQPVEYTDPLALREEIQRLERLKDKGRLSWQDTYRLGVAYIQTGRIEDAVDALEEAKRKKPDFSKTYESLGMAYYRLGRWNEAIATWQKAMSINPEARFLEEMIGLARRKIDINKRILSLEEEIKGTDRPEWQKRFELAILYLSEKRIDEAERHLEEVVKIKKDDATVYDALAQVYALKGEYEKAVEAEKKAVELKPDDETLKRRLKEMERITEALKKGDYHKGVEMNR